MICFSVEKPGCWPFLSSPRTLFDNTLAKFERGFAEGLLRGLQPRGATIFSEKFKFDAEQLLFLRDDDLTPTDHVGLCLQLAEHLDHWSISFGFNRPCCLVVKSGLVLLSPSCFSALML